MRNPQASDKTIFWKNGSLLHSAIVSSLTNCSSKLGHYGVYKATIAEMESIYGSTTKSYYIPK